MESSREIWNHEVSQAVDIAAALLPRDVLRRESTGLYTEAIRRKQLKEVELLFDHYLKLIKSPAAGYDEKIRDVYKSADEYRYFVKKLEKRELDVIEASISTVKKGSKKERFAWYSKVRQKAHELRMKEIERSFSLGVSKPCHLEEEKIGSSRNIDLR